MNAKPTLEILEPSLISEMARRAPLTALEILYPCMDPRGQSARTLTPADLARPVSEASAFYRSPVVSRSHKQRGTKGEA